MNRVSNFLMVVALACVTFACGDNEEEKLPPLSLAYIELTTGSDATQMLPGDAGTKSFTVDASRKFEAEADVPWITVSVSDNTVTLTVTRNELVPGTKPNKRSGVVTLQALPEREGDNVANVKLTVDVQQALYGLVTANLLDVVFNATGATDISPLANPVLNVLPFRASLSALDASYQTWWSVQEKPDYRNNASYGRTTAYFHGGQNENADNHALVLAGDNTKRGDRGSCCLRVDYADFSNVKADYLSSGGFEPNATTDVSSKIIPMNALGKALFSSPGYSMECIFRPEPWGNRKYVFSSTQSSGHGFEVDGQDFSWYSESCLPYTGPGADGSKSGVTLVGGVKNESGTQKSDLAVKYHLSDEEYAATDRYYHFIGTFENPVNGSQPVMKLYLNGMPVMDSDGDGKGDWAGTSTGTGTPVEVKGPAGNVLRVGTPGTDALSQWYAIGGNARRADHPSMPNVHWNRTDNNGTTDAGDDWAERVFFGEIVLARIYDKALSAEEAKVLYEYEKPE